MSLLELKNVHTYYGHIHALKGISLTVEEGEIVTLIGSNGAGKTTTLRTISGLVKPRQGEVLFQGRPIHRLPAHEIVRLSPVWTAASGALVRLAEELCLCRGGGERFGDRVENLGFHGQDDGGNNQQAQTGRESLRV